MQFIDIKVPATEMEIESRGVKCIVEVAKIPHDLLVQLALHGIKQKVSDAASQSALDAWKSIKGEDAPKPSRDQMATFAEGAGRQKIAEYTLASMDKARQSLYDGKWSIRESGGTSTKYNEVDTLALELAKADLVAVFKKACAAKGVKATLENYHTVSPAIAKYFKVDGKKPVWIDSQVFAFIESKMETGPDYRQVARDELARRAEMVNSINLDDILGDI